MKEDEDKIRLSGFTQLVFGTAPDPVRVKALSSGQFVIDVKGNPPNRQAAFEAL